MEFGTYCGFEDAELIVLAVAPKHLALNVQATGCAHYVGCHSDAGTVGKPTDGWMAGRQARRLRSIEGETSRFGQPDGKVVKGRSG